MRDILEGYWHLTLANVKIVLFFNLLIGLVTKLSSPVFVLIISAGDTNSPSVLQGKARLTSGRTFLSSGALEPGVRRGVGWVTRAA